MFIEESKLERLLTKAYEEGWYGSKDLAQEAANKIILDYRNEEKSQEPTLHAKKKALKKTTAAASKKPAAKKTTTSKAKAVPKKPAGGKTDKK